MLKLIEKVEEKFGGTEKAAEALGITSRHLRRVKQKNNASETLKILIEKFAQEKAA